MSPHGEPAAQPGTSRHPAAGSDSAELAGRLAGAAQWLAGRLGDPAVPHTVDELAEITRGFAATVDGLAEGLHGVTEWLRAAGHAGALSGHAGAVGEHLAHAGRELARLPEAVDAAEQRR